MIRLCQRPAASCGACCGLYNRADHDRDALRADLTRRTRLLARTERTPDAFAVAIRTLDADAPAPLFASVRNCALLGWLDEAETRVGCLAHPLATGGIDLRACGVYDVTTCEAFLCPSHAWLSEREVEIAELATGDFYLYGLVVTDVPFLRAVLEALATRTGARLERRHLTHRPLLAALTRLLALKEELEPGSEGLFGAFRPGRDGGEVERRLDYEELGRPTSPYDQILRCVGADPRSGNDLDRLEELVRRRLDACAAAFPSAAER